MTETAQKGQEQAKKGLSSIVSQLPVDRLREEAQGFGQALTQRGLSKMSERVDSLTDKLNGVADGSTVQAAKDVAKGENPVKAGVKATATKAKDAVKEKLGGGSKGGSGAKVKVTHIYETIEVPVPRDVAYAQWTQFEEFPKFMKKVETVSQESDEKLKWQAQIFWSHRSWEAKIIDQVPNERIVWKSTGEKGHVDGAVTFHEMAPELTKIVMVLEYHPKGFFEKTGNIWRAQGRRARLELKHFARHVATHTLVNQDEVDGWEGRIEDGHVVEDDQQDDRQDDRQDDQQDDQTDDQTDEEQDEAEDQAEDQQDEDDADDEADETADETDDEADEPEEGSRRGSAED